MKSGFCNKCAHFKNCDLPCRPVELFLKKNNTNINNDASVYLNSYSVTESGYLDFPMVGEIFVRNMNVDEIRDAISEKLAEYLKVPEDISKRFSTIDTYS